MPRGRRVSTPTALALCLTLGAPLASKTARADPPARAGNGGEGATSSQEVLAYTALGLAAAALAVGVVETVRAVSLAEQNGQDRAHVPTSVGDVCATQLSSYAVDACQTAHEATTAQTIAWIGYGSAAALATTGLLLLLTAPHPPTAASSSTRATALVDVTPSVSPRGGGLALRVSF